MKKIMKIIFLILILIITCIVVIKAQPNDILLRVNWNVSVLKPDEVEGIYRFDYREGDDFQIWKYSDSKLKELKENKIFTLISEDTTESAKDIFNSHYNDLSYNEDLQMKFNERFSIDDMVVENNYYALLENEEKNPGCYLLLLINTKTNELYYFNHIR